MKEGNLPIDVAQEPCEEARLSQDSIASSQVMESTSRKRKGITFADATQSTPNSPSQSSSAYKEALSQPAPGLSHRQRLQWLQRRRARGLWAQCELCGRWRFLPDVLDSHELPAKWTCRLNPDKAAADCSVPEAPIRLRDEEDLIHGEYSAGSVVWARLAGWPWWPAMVDDCPDTEQYYWLDGFSDIPTHYNVVFFDAQDVTRAWIAPEQLRPYESNKKFFKKFAKDKFKKRIEAAMTQAEDAEKLPLAKRLGKYSFIARYSGSINQPKNITKRELEKFQKQLKRKYNVEFPDEASSDDEVISRPQSVTTVIRTGENVLLVGTPKSSQKRKRVAKSKKVEKKNENVKFKDSLLGNENDESQNMIENETVNETDTYKQPHSMVAQVGSTVTSTVLEESAEGFDNDTSKTYVPDSELIQETNGTLKGDTEDDKGFTVRIASPSSDDFDF